jgi:hypothetical protein
MLTLLTYLRKLLTTQEDPAYASIFKRTTIMQIIDTALSFEHEPGDMYFLKLEALWILNNLACCPDKEAKHVVGEGNVILSRLAYELDRLIKNQFKDGLTTKLVFNVLLNICSTSNKYAALLLD